MSTPDPSPALTGWHDELGIPAPWPDDIFDPDSDWHPAGSEDPDDRLIDF